MISWKSVWEWNHRSDVCMWSAVSFRSLTRFCNNVVVDKPSKYFCFTWDNPHGWFRTCRTIFWNLRGGGTFGFWWCWCWCWCLFCCCPQPTQSNKGEFGEHGDEKNKDESQDRQLVYRIGVKYPSMYTTAAQCFGTISSNTSQAKNFACRDWMMWFFVVLSALSISISRLLSPMALLLLVVVVVVLCPPAISPRCCDDDDDDDTILVQPGAGKSGRFVTNKNRTWHQWR